MCCFSRYSLSDLRVCNRHMPKYNNTKLHTLIYNWQAWDWHLIFIPGTYKNTMIEAYQLSPTTVRNFKMQIDYQWTEEVRNCKMQFPTYGTLHIYNNNCILWSTGFNLTLLGLPPLIKCFEWIDPWQLSIKWTVHQTKDKKEGDGKEDMTLQ